MYVIVYIANVINYLASADVYYNMTKKIIGTFILRDFAKIGQVSGIINHTGSIEVDVINYTKEDLNEIWAIIGDCTTFVEVTDTDWGVVYKCSIKGTLQLICADNVASFQLKVLEKEGLEPEQP